jgi:DNA-binding Xre family transcriptional regulator
MAALSAKPPEQMPITCSLDVEMADRKLTNEMLAASAGVHRSSIAKLRRNQFLMLDVGVLEKVCKALGLQPGDLLHLE